MRHTVKDRRPDHGITVRRGMVIEPVVGDDEENVWPVITMKRSTEEAETEKQIFHKS